MPEPASKTIVWPVCSSVTSRQGVLHPCPMPDGVAHGTDPRTPQNRTRILHSFAWSTVCTRAREPGRTRTPRGRADARCNLPREESMSTIVLNVNGRPHTVDVDPATPLLYVLSD